MGLWCKWNYDAPVADSNLYNSVEEHTLYQMEYMHTYDRISMYSGATFSVYTRNHEQRCSLELFAILKV